MKCRRIQEDIYPWLEGGLSGNQKVELEAHMEMCASCREAADAVRNLNRALLDCVREIQPSPGFEASFWSEVSDRARDPWFIRWLHDFEFSLPTPGWTEGVALLVIALLVGGTGGAVSTRYLSDFHEFKGVSAPSVAAAYFKAIDERENA